MLTYLYYLYSSSSSSQLNAKTQFNFNFTRFPLRRYSRQQFFSLCILKLKTIKVFFSFFFFLRPILSMATQTSSFLSSSSSSWKYDVFLSFCSFDTCKTFADHLYTALKQKGIITFRDDEKLEQGKYISTEILKAIEGSKYAIVVISKNYASSKWCLIELAKIVECMMETRLTVLPVFYHVDYSEVRNQMENLAETFTKHEKDPMVNKEDVQDWKDALKEVGNISGWYINDRHESTAIQEILQSISSELNLIIQSTISKELVGIESRAREMLDLYLDERLGGVCFLGICGMGGMGKTTLALDIYERISGSFEASSFIANVREKTKNQHLVSLQEQLLSDILMGSKINIWNVFEGINNIGNRLRDKKVLIVLDDVDEEKQLEALAGNHDWFGLGSRIIVTGRDSHLLRRCGVDYIYTAKGLNNDEALQLFSLSAFKKPYPKENYVDLSMYFVNYTNGLPLALKVLGSLLFNKSVDEWKSAIDKLKAEPDKEILDVLQISFDGLTYMQKELFLDIACFFKGENKDCIRDILQSFGYYPDYNIGVLIDKSLITINKEGTLWMHDLLQEMGQEIVRCESPKEPSGRSRLWLYEDVLHILKNNTGTDVIEGIVLNTPFQKEEHLNAETFSKIKKLRLLKINNMQPPQGLIRGNVQLPQGLSYLSNELRVIEWHGYPLKSMPSSFQPNKLVELRMHCSRIKQLWKGIMNLGELKLIDLSDSQNLIETPDLSGASNLKQLILQGCTRLCKIHGSLGNLKWLIRLDLSGCQCLESLPEKINLESLEVFILAGCSRLKKFPEVACYSLMPLKILTLSGCLKLDELPENLGKFEVLEELDVSRTAIKGLPKSINLLKNLRLLSLHGCGGISPKSSNKLLNFPLMLERSIDPMGMLAHTLSGLCALTKLDLSYCNLQKIPDVIGCLGSLLQLDLQGNNFVCLPESMTQLSNLKFLYLTYCTSLRSLPKLPSNIEAITARGCNSLETLSISPDYNFCPSLDLHNCLKLIENQGYGDVLSTMLRRYFIKSHCKQSSYSLVIPGSQIPKWFSHQNVGASVNLQVPSHLCNKFKGIVVCIVFVLHQKLFSINDCGFMRCTHKLRRSIKANGYEAGSSYLLLSKDIRKIESHQLQLEYYPSTCFGKGWMKELNRVNANGFSQIEVTLETEGLGLEVTKCGAHLVFEQDIEHLNQTMAGCSSCIITPYEDDLQDSAKDTKIKRSRDDSYGDGAGPSEEGTSNDAPHRKRIQLPNLIERFIPHLGNWIGNLSTQGQGDSDCEEESQGKG